MPPPCRTHFASPGAAHTAPAHPQGGDVSLRTLGTEPQAGQGDRAWAGGWKVDGMGCAVHGSLADEVQRVLRASRVSCH